MICFCDNVDFGTYAHTVSMRTPFDLEHRDDRWVTIDVCIATEIAELWHKGIKTLNSCCGHQKVRPSVIVDKSSYDDMDNLGYKYEMLENGRREYFFEQKWYENNPNLINGNIAI